MVSSFCRFPDSWTLKGQSSLIEHMLSLCCIIAWLTLLIKELFFMNLEMFWSDCRCVSCLWTAENHRRGTGWLQPAAWCAAVSEIIDLSDEFLPSFLSNFPKKQHQNSKETFFHRVYSHPKLPSDASAKLLPHGTQTSRRVSLSLNIFWVWTVNGTYIVLHVEQNDSIFLSYNFIALLCWLSSPEIWIRPREWAKTTQQRV